jgi:hypothetical protein
MRLPLQTGEFRVLSDHNQQPTTRTTANAVNWQPFLCRPRKIANKIYEQSFLWARSLCQYFDAVLVQWLQCSFPPKCDDAIWKTGSMRHLFYASRFPHLA